MAKNYDEIDVSKWNTRHFKQYLEAEHMRNYDVLYTPGIPHQAEAGLLATYIGNGPRSKRKIPRKVSNELLKEFIDRCFADWRPTAQYQNITFSFMHNYMGRHLVAADKDMRKATADKSAQVAQVDTLAAANEWF